MWSLPGPGIELMSPALAGVFLPLHHQGSPQPLFLFSFTSPVTPFDTLFLFMVCIVPTAFYILFILFLFL